jgi:hypothetical protein
VMEVELQAVMHTIAEHDIQNALRKWRLYARRQTTSMVVVASKSKVSSDQMAALVPEISDGNVV